MAGLHSAPGREVYLLIFVSKNISNLPETETEVLWGVKEGIEKGKLFAQGSPKGSRSCVLLFFNLSPFINKLRGDEVIRSRTISNGGGKKRRGSPAGMGYDQRSLLKNR